MGGGRVGLGGRVGKGRVGGPNPNRGTQCGIVAIKGRNVTNLVPNDQKYPNSLNQ